ncbi:MAG: hypothetical protein OEY05_11700 [Paracoccaceae bacterium]|nr:hypothetical protein [Paracoccaceae bacterium]
MVGTSKILTVSYGTFSCTLEGFDEPFSTMKAIAEYFRDLAADDRYFGAEPPTPDANMLHRIAEGEIQRRVEAKINASGVVLKAHGSEAPEESPQAPASAPVTAAETEQPVAPTQDVDAESAAEKLKRIRAVVADRNLALADRPDAGYTGADFDDADLAADTGPYADIDATDFGFDLDLPEPPAVEGRAAVPEAAEMPTAESDEEPAAVSDDTLAPEAEQDIETEVSDAAPDLEPVTAAQEDLVADQEDDLPVQPAEEPVDQPIADAPADSAIDRILAAETSDDFDDAEDDLEIDEATEEDVSAVSDDEPDDGLSFIQRARARVIKIRRNENAPQPVIPATTADAAPAPASEPGEPVAETGSATPTAELPATESFDAEDEDDIDTDDEADEAPSSVEDAEAAILADISASLGNTGLDADDEEDLLRELAAAARNGEGRDGHEGRAILEGKVRDDEADLSRLMEEAKSQLEGDENRRRFSAISHLKAAVAATVADRKMNDGDSPAGTQARTAREMDRYRDDLSKVVRPHHPDAEETPAGRRAAQDRAAPLVLVSEQRIDTDDTPADPKSVRPVHPSKLQTTHTDEDDDDIDAMIAAMPSPESAKSFAEFAERMGATGLSDLLEVAAAYTATVEGLPHFSRPQILLKVAHVADDASYSREDGLRTFGMLLRDGKIEKLRRGQFKITEASKYMSEARRAAN